VDVVIGKLSFSLRCTVDRLYTVKPSMCRMSLGCRTFTDVGAKLVIESKKEKAWRFLKKSEIRFAVYR